MVGCVKGFFGGAFGFPPGLKEVFEHGVEGDGGEVGFAVPELVVRLVEFVGAQVVHDVVERALVVFEAPFPLLADPGGAVVVLAV